MRNILVTVIPLQFPQTSLGCIFDLCISSTFPILTGADPGNEVRHEFTKVHSLPRKRCASISNLCPGVTKHHFLCYEIRQAHDAPNNLIPKKDLTKHITPKKIHWQVFHVIFGP